MVSTKPDSMPPTDDRYDHKNDGPDYRSDRKYILEELRRLDAKQERMGDELKQTVHESEFRDLEKRTRYNEAALVGLKVRASVWGGLAGLIPVVMWLAARALSGK